MIIHPRIESKLLESIPFVRMAFSTRQGGVSPELYGMNLSYRVGDAHENVEKNRYRFLEMSGMDQLRLAFPEQIHSSTVRVANQPRNVVLRGQPGTYPETDGLITNKEHLLLSVTIADCVPIILVDPNTKSIGLVHAGWRGTKSGIVSSALRMMESELNCSAHDIYAFIGPSAGDCCYDVGQDVGDMFSEKVKIKRNGQIFLDLKKANLLQLIEAGLSETHIEVSNSCTICEPEIFHSFRRDGNHSGRMMGVLGIFNDKE